MAYQISGEAPFGTQIGANAMMSSSSFTRVPVMGLRLHDESAV